MLINIKKKVEISENWKKRLIYTITNNDNEVYKMIKRKINRMKTKQTTNALKSKLAYDKYIELEKEYETDKIDFLRITKGHDFIFNIYIPDKYETETRIIFSEHHDFEDGFCRVDKHTKLYKMIKEYMFNKLIVGVPTINGNHIYYIDEPELNHILKTIRELKLERIINN